MLLKIILGVLALGIVFPLLFASLMMLGAKASNRSYKKVEKETSDSFFEKDGKIYYSIGGNLTFVGASELYGCDAASFRVLGTNLGTDKDRIYYGGRVLGLAEDCIEGPAANELEVIEAHPDLVNANKNELELYTYEYAATGERQQSAFLRDQHNVFVYPQLLEGADPDQFKAVSFNYGHDQQFIYFEDRRLEPFNGQSIKVTQFDWEEDILFVDNNVYIAGNLRTDIDASSLKAIAKNHMVDKNTAYFERTPIEDSEPSTYTTFKNSDYYSKDERNVYYSGKKLHNADPESFKVLGQYGEVVSDKDHFYFTNVKVLNLKPGKDFRVNPTSMVEYKYQTLQLTEDTALILDHDEVKELSDHSPIVIYNNQVYDKFRGLLDGAKPESIQLIEHNNLYVISEEKLYYDAKVMEGVNPDECKIYPFDHTLSHYVETDKHVYFRGNPLKAEGIVYVREQNDGALTSFEGNHFVCNTRYCFWDDKRVINLSPEQAATVTYEEMENFEVEGD
jgi:hypothetical protein